MALGMSVQKLLASTDSRELAEWEAYERLEPFGEQRADWRIAQVACILANVNRKKGAPAFKVDDFMLKTGAAPKTQQVSATDLAQQLKGITRAMGGRIK